MSATIVQVGLDLPELRDRVRRAWSADRVGTREDGLAAEGRALVEKIVVTGDAAAKRLAETGLSPEARAHAASTLFEWPEGAKRLLLLWRDVQLEWERAAVLLAEGRTERDALQVLAKASEDALLDAADAWLERHDRRLAELGADAGARERALYEWSLQDSPWPTYRAQFEAIGAQLARLHADFAVRTESAGTIVRLQSELLGVQRYVTELLDELEARHAEALGLLAGEDTPSPDGDVIARLERLDPAGLVRGYVEEATRDANAIIDDLPDRVELFVRGASGMQYRTVELERQTGQWVSAEVIPLLQRADRNVSQVTLDLSRVLNEVRSKLSLAVEDAGGATSGEHVMEAVREPLVVYAQRLAKTRATIVGDLGRAEAKVRDELRLSRVYEPAASFLEVSFEAGMSQVLLSQDALLSRFGQWLGVQRKTFRRLRKRVSEEEALSEGERIVRVLRTRRADARVSGYNGVIVTRGFIGEAFHAGRDYELARAAEAVAAFREGYRGAILVTGQRYSGRSHFAELIAGRYFEQRTVRLRPQQSFEVAGRTHTATYDLGEALAFVRKHSVGQELLVFVDDLELWANATTPLAANAEALGRAIDELSARVMFVVTAGNWTRHRLTRALHADGVFQVEINMDDFLMEDFQQTVLVRHAATHFNLLGRDGKALGEAALRDHAEDVYRAARGNIGDGLRRWSQSVERAGVGEVRLHRRPNYALPNFIDADNGVLLTTLKCRRYANEYELRKAFGPAFEREYRTLLLRLQRIGVLERHHSGTLAIAPTVTNEIGRLLEREGYLQATYARQPLHL